MEQTYLLASPSCSRCKEFATKSELNLNQGKPYGSNIFNIPDSFNINSGSFGATNFYGFSLSEYGRFIYKSNNKSYNVQKMSFPDLDTLYLTNKNNKWMLGIS